VEQRMIQHTALTDLTSGSVCTLRRISQQGFQSCHSPAQWQQWTVQKHSTADTVVCRTVMPAISSAYQYNQILCQWIHPLIYTVNTAAATTFHVIFTIVAASYLSTKQDMWGFPDACLLLASQQCDTIPFAASMHKGVVYCIQSMQRAIGWKVKYMTRISCTNQ